MYEWSSIDALRVDTAFERAWAELSNPQRDQVRRALSHATTAALVYIRAERASPHFWQGLPESVVEPLELSVRTSLSLGVYRANLSTAVGTGRSPLSDAAVRAAAAIETRSLVNCLRRLGQVDPRLASIEAKRPTAFHQVVATLGRGQPDALRFAEACIGASIALDDLIVRHRDDVTRVVGPQRQVRKSIATTARSLDVPPAAAAAIWALALRGRCDLYGQDEDTQSYSDEVVGDFDLGELVELTED